MKKVTNTMKMEIKALSNNESFARSVVAAFAGQLDPLVDEIADLKTAVSEAVTNAIVHSTTDRVLIECELWVDKFKRGISVTVTDFGTGIANIEKALEPFFTTKPTEERSGMGFTVMQSFMDTLRVTNGAHCGTIVTMSKVFNNQEARG